MLNSVALLGLVSLPSLAVAEEWTPSSQQARLIEAFHSVRVPDPPSFAALAKELANDARKEQAFILDVLVERSVPAFGDEGRQVLSENQEELILVTLSDLPATALRTWAVESIEASDSKRLTAGLLVLGVVGQSPDLAHALERLGELDGEGVSRFQRRAALRCLAGILERDRGAMLSLKTRWSAVPDALASLVAESVACSGRAEGLLVLGEMLRGRSDSAARVLPHVRALTPAPRRDLVEDIGEAVRDVLASTDSDLHSLACLVAGDIEDRDAIPALVTSLTEGPPPVQDAALWALRRIVGTNLVSDAEVWKEWIEAEESWFATDWRKRRNELRSADKVKVLKALRELSMHPLYRHESAELIRSVLQHRSAQVRLAAVQVLMELGSPVSVPALIDSLEDRDVDVRKAAHEGLQAITGLDARLDLHDWLQVAFEHGYLIT